MTYIARNTPAGEVATPSSFFAQFSPKSAFIIGAVGGILTFCTVGFIVLLTLFLQAN